MVLLIGFVRRMSTSMRVGNVSASYSSSARRPDMSTSPSLFPLPAKPSAKSPIAAL
ncbi:MAG TPA: hypothetical protein VFN38_17235 [Gemmatimonadaceae bacterium]|nr:hypothetical protein [Gemmatimonadaceae bacterium]